MKGSDLIYLAGTADLARLEFASPRLTLLTTDDRFYAQYAGAYSSGSRWIERDRTIPSLDIDIDSDKFKHMAATFTADAEVRVSQTGNSLALRSKGSNHTLRCYPSTERLEFPNDVRPFAVCDAEKLLDEIELASDLNDQNKENKGPGGINLSVSKERSYIRVMAFNGRSALFLAQITPEEVVADASIVIPAKDFVKGVTLFSNGLIQLGLSAGRLAMQSSAAWFTCPTDSRPWPDLMAMLKKNPAAQHVTFTADQLKSAAQSARILGATGVLEISGTDDGVVLKTVASESGQFSTAVEGELDGSYYYGTEDLLFASKLSKGEITFEIAKGSTTIRLDRRMLAMVSRAI